MFNNFNDETSIKTQKFVKVLFRGFRDLTAFQTGLNDRITD
jgi:hypothetical protein